MCKKHILEKLATKAALEVVQQFDSKTKIEEILAVDELLTDETVNIMRPNVRSKLKPISISKTPVRGPHIHFEFRLYNSYIYQNQS